MDTHPPAPIRNMKKLTTILAVIFTVSYLLSLTFSFFHLTGAVIPFLVFKVSFFLLLTFQVVVQIKQDNRLINWLAQLSVVIIGFTLYLYTSQSSSEWTSLDSIAIFGVSLLLVHLLGVVIKDKAMGSSIASSVLVILFALSPEPFQKSQSRELHSAITLNLESSMERYEAELIRMEDVTTRHLEVCHFEQPREALSFHSNTIQLVQAIDTLKAKLLARSLGLDMVSVSKISPESVVNYFGELDEYHVSTAMLVGAEPGRPIETPYSAGWLKEKIRTYEQSPFLNNELGLDDFGIDVNKEYGQEIKEAWIIRKFYHISVGSCIATLCDIQSQIIALHNTAILEYSICDEVNHKSTFG